MMIIKLSYIFHFLLNLLNNRILSKWLFFFRLVYACLHISILNVLKIFIIIIIITIDSLSNNKNHKIELNYNKKEKKKRFIHIMKFFTLLKSIFPIPT